MTPAERWRAQLEAWVIPSELLDAVEDDPYQWPVELFRRRNISAKDEGPTRTADVIGMLLGPAGTLLDVGAGTGRASLQFAICGRAVTGIEKSERMAAGLRAEIAQAGVEYAILTGTWPALADQVGDFDVVVAAHVVYDVGDIAPFIDAISAHATRGVVLELTETHPWAPLGPYYRSLHGIDRPSGPTVEDLVDVVVDVTGRMPAVDRWRRPGGMWFESWDEVVELYGRRLVLPRDRWPELRPLLEPDIRVDRGRMTIGPPHRELATLWWRT